jgi:hypothetical protein
MKKLAVLFLCLFVFAGNAQAKNYERKIVKNADVKQVQTVLKDVIDLYKGVITVIMFDTEEHKYVVEYNATTLTAEVGITKGSSQKFPKAQFSCRLVPKGNNVEIIMRKVNYTGWFGKKIVFDHQKKFYEELKYNGYQVEDVN